MTRVRSAHGCRRDVTQEATLIVGAAMQSARRPPALVTRPRVAVVTLCDELLGDICAASIANKRAYADRHGCALPTPFPTQHPPTY